MKYNRGGVAMALFLISACGSTSASQEEAGPADSGENAVDTAGSTDGAGSGDSSGLQDSAPSDVSMSDEDGGAAPIDAATGDGGGDGPIDAATGDGGGNGPIDAATAVATDPPMRREATAERARPA